MYQVLAEKDLQLEGLLAEKQSQGGDAGGTAERMLERNERDIKAMVDQIDEMKSQVPFRL